MPVPLLSVRGWSDAGRRALYPSLTIAHHSAVVARGRAERGRVTAATQQIPPSRTARAVMLERGHVEGAERDEELRHRPADHTFEDVADVVMPRRVSVPRDENSRAWPSMPGGRSSKLRGGRSRTRASAEWLSSSPAPTPATSDARLAGARRRGCPSQPQRASRHPSTRSTAEPRPFSNAARSLALRLSRTEASASLTRPTASASSVLPAGVTISA
jgi:hypothetical protein